MKTFNGEWFLPSQPERKIPGILTINEDHSQISLLLYSEGEISKNFNNQIVLGTSGLDKITLCRCYAKGAKHIGLSQNFWSSRYYSNYAFIGCHFNSEDEIKFSEISIQYEHLNNWMDAGLRYSFYPEQNNNTGKLCRYFQHPDFNITLNEHCNLIFQRHWWGKGKGTKETTEGVKHFATFKFQHPESFSRILGLNVALQNFLILGINSTLNIMETFGFLNNQESINERIEIYGGSSIKRKKKPHFIHHSHMKLSYNNSSIFNYNLVEEEMGRILKKWFEDYDKLEPIYSIFFHAIIPFWKEGNLTINNVDYNNSYLNLVQALESYHRAKYDVQKDINEFNNKKEGIIQKAKCLNQEEKEWIMKNAMPKRKDDFTLNERLRALIIDKTLYEGLFRDPQKVIVTIKEMRDRLTHIVHKNSKEIRIADVFDYAQILFIATILKDLGLDAQKIREIIASSPPIRKWGRSLPI